MKKPQIYVGTSGYSYPHWMEGVFYPRGLKPSEFLEYYTKHFNSVELNVTFYRLPQENVFKSWYKRSPQNFCFVVKGSRFITHLKKLKDCEDSLKLFFNRARALKDKMKVVLWQFPPGWKKDVTRLKDFFKILKKTPAAKKINHVFEFRHPSWFENEVYRLLKSENYALCIADSNRWPSEKIITGDFIYLRFHGGRVLYGSNYSLRELKKWADFANPLLKEGKNLFAFFNNDTHGYAVKNALKFKKLLK